MASYNRVLLLGNLTRDPQLRYLPSQTAIAEFGLACNRKFKTQSGEEREEVTFVDITAFGRQAEVINQYCQKGRPIFIEGRLKYDTWEDKNGGGKRHKLSVVVDNFQLLGGRPEGGGGPPPEGGQSARPSPRPPQARPQSAPTQAPSAQDAPPITDEEHFKEDDIPF
jgi:single-strand DNA-binding protein